MSLFEMKVEIPAGVADVTENALIELGLETWSLLEDAIGKRAWIVGIFESEAAADSAWDELAPHLIDAVVTLYSEPIARPLADVEWRDSYKAHFHAWQFGRLHWVPVWERETFRLPPGDAVLWLDPGMAFGTGNHETTRLCCERLVALAAAASQPARSRVIDVGCGSGILALSAALLGFGDVRGFDHDPEAVRVSEENATLNGVADRVRFFTGELATGLAGAQAEVILANIQADVLMKFSRELLAAVAPGGSLVLSGILAMESENVQNAFEAVARSWEMDVCVMNEWTDVMLTRPS